MRIEREDPLVFLLSRRKFFSPLMQQAGRKMRLRLQAARVLVLLELSELLRRKLSIPCQKCPLLQVRVVSASEATYRAIASSHHLLVLCWSSKGNQTGQGS